MVYLAQLPDDKLEAKARDAAERLGLAFELRLTGLGGLERFFSTTRPAATRAPADAVALPVT